MRRFRLTSGLVLFSLLPLVATAEPWTLDRAVATALEHSPDARIARARIDAAQAMVTQAQAAWMPQLMGFDQFRGARLLEIG